MNHAVRLLISFLFSLSAYATCPDAPTSTLECRGAKLVTNQSELDAYLQNFAENTTKGFIRGVRLRGNFSGISQNITSPCKIIIDEASTLNFSEELCLISKDKVIARRGLNLFGKDVTLKAPNRVIIQDNATIDLSGDLTLHSHGPTEESRAHIRHSANVKVNNLTLRGLYRSTLGKESTYEAQGKISIFSTGEERPTDEDISEWSTVWRDTTIQADEFEARALWRVKVGTRTAINASKITLDGQGCKIGRDATLTALEKQGRCLLPNRPVARFKISPKEASIGESILLDGSRAQNAAAGESFRWRINMPNGERIDTRKVEGPTYEFTPTQAGEHTIELRVYDQDGFHDWKKKKLIVRGSELFSYYKFELEEEKLSLIYEGRALSDDRSIVEAFYTAPDGNRIDVGRRVLGHVDVIDSFDATEPVDLKLTVVDDLGTREEFTHTIEPRAEFQRPVLNFETIEYAPNELVFFSNFMFDPYNQLSDFDGFTLDFGDESSVEINAESFSTTHLYSSEGQYPAKIYAGDYENEKEVTATGSPSSFEFPLADFKVDGASWAPGVRLYVDQTISPASPIQSYLWRLGDGTTAYGPEVLHFYNEGAYDVSLTVILDNGTSSTVTREVIIMQTAPNLVGTVDCYDIGDKKAECHVEALDKLSDLKTLNINFGDNPQNIESTTVSGQWAEHTFIHSYEETGNYTVTMQALTNRGEEFFTTTEVAIGENPSNLPPVAILGCYPVYQDVICYSDSSYDPDGYITNYEYDFGDGTVINTTDTEVFHRFENTGTFTINLTVTDNFGVTASYPETVVIEEKPNEFPVPQLSCDSNAPQMLTCDGRNSFDPDGTITGGRLTAVETGEVFETDDLNALQKTFTFTSGGLKTIILEVQDDQGVIVPLEREFETMANVPPIVSFFCISSSIGTLSCDGSNSTLGNAPSFSSFGWVINGENYSGETIEVTGLIEDQASVSLTVIDSLGESSSKMDTFEVIQNDLPIGDFNCTSPSPQQLNCLANYSDSDGEVVSYTWSVEGQQFSGNYFETTLDSGGEVSVSLTVKDDFGSEVFQNKSVQVIENQAPVAIIKVDRNGKIAPATFNLSAEDSYDNDGSITSYKWSLPDGELQNGKNLNIDLEFPQKLYIELTVTDNQGMESSSSFEIVATQQINPTILAGVNNESLPAVIELQTDTLTDVHGDLLDFEWWINGEKVSQNPSFAHHATKEYFNSIFLKINDKYGNTKVVERQIILNKPSNYFELKNSEIYGITGETYEIELEELSLSKEDTEIVLTSNNDSFYLNLRGDNFIEITSANQESGSIKIEIADTEQPFSRELQVEFKALSPLSSSDYVDGDVFLNNEKVFGIDPINASSLSIKKASYSNGNTLFTFENVSDQKRIDIHLDTDLHKTAIVKDTLVHFQNGKQSKVDVDWVGFGLGEIPLTIGPKCSGPNIEDKKAVLIVATATENIGTFGRAKIYNQNLIFSNYYLDEFTNYTLTPIPFPESAYLYDVTIDFNKKIPRVLENVTNNLHFKADVPLVFIPKTDNFFRKVYDKPAGVFEGFEAIFLNKYYFKSYQYDNYRYIHTLVHENHHITDNLSTCSGGFSDVAPNQLKVFKESRADLTALEYLLEMTQDGRDQFVSGLSDFTNLRGKNSNINIDMRSHLTQGLLLNQEYWNELYMSLLLNNVNLVNKTSFKIEEELDKANISPRSLEMVMGIAYSDAYKKLGFELDKASIPISSSFNLNSFSMGFFQINKTTIESSLQGRDENTFNFTIEKDDAVRFNLFHKDIDKDHVTKMVIIGEPTETTPGRAIYEMSVTFRSKEDITSLYIAVASGSKDSSKFEFKKGPICFNGVDLRFDNVCAAECKPGLESYWAQEKICVLCNSEIEGNFDSTNGQCIYNPRKIGEWDTIGDSSASEQCNNLLERKESGTGFVRQTVGGYKSVTFQCGYEPSFVVKYHNDVGICDPITGFEQAGEVLTQNKPKASEVSCEN